MTYLEVHEYAYCSFAIIEGTPHARVTPTHPLRTAVFIYPGSTRSKGSTTSTVCGII